jgi:pilus assembly protein Flp/PilA
MKNTLINPRNKMLFFFNKEKGATMVEYAIMLALIATVSIAIIRTLGQSVSGLYQTANTSMSGLG